RHPGRRGRAGRAVVEGLAVRPLRADLRGHQRDPAQHRRRACARAAPEVAPPCPRRPHRPHRPRRTRRSRHAGASPPPRRARPPPQGPRDMRFAFTEDQLAFRDAVRDLLAKECTPEVVRSAWPAGADAHGARKGEGARSEPERVAQAWAALAEMGVLGSSVSEANGGLGMGVTDWVLRAEETGYAALPHPFVETACVVAPLLDSVGDPDGVVAELIDGSRQAGVVPLTGSLVPWGDE